MSTSFVEQKTPNECLSNELQVHKVVPFLQAFITYALHITGLGSANGSIHMYTTCMNVIPTNDSTYSCIDLQTRCNPPVSKQL